MNQRNSSRVNTLLRKERLLRGWSQQNLAHHLGVTIVTVNRWERGAQQPSPLFRLKLCQLFGKSEDELGLWNEQTPIGSTATPEQQDMPLNALSAEKPSVLPQEAKLPPAQVLDHSSLGHDIHTTLTPVSTFANTSSQPLPAFQTVPHVEEPAYEARASVMQTKHLSPEYLLPFPLLMLLLSLFLVLTPLVLQLCSSPLQVAHLTSASQPITSGHLLYKAQWSKGLGGWIASSHWHWSKQNGGMITTDSMTNSLMLAPYQVSTSTYAIEASIQRLSYSNLEGNAYGVMIGKTSQNGAVCGIGIHEKPEHFFISQLAAPTRQSQPMIAHDLFRSPVVLDAQWHAYYVEVTPNHMRFFLDRKLIGQVNNDIHIQQGQVGIYAVGTFIAIKSFAIFAL